MEVVVDMRSRRATDVPRRDPSDARSASARALPPMRMQTLRAILVDIDGTLIDSNGAHARTWQQILARHGHAFPDDRIRPLIGKGGDKMLADLLPDVETDRGSALMHERAQLFLSQELHGLQPTRGARDLLLTLRARHLKVVVATSAQASETALLLKQAGLDDLIDGAADSSDADETKPDPDIVQAALQRAGVLPSESLMLGDTPWDIAAARRAGVRTIALRCGGWWNDDAFEGAVEIRDDPADLAANLERSEIGVRLAAHRR